ncbi:MAG: 2-amino-4-hydroxy-6-hydroxymethyldihydropteridine diphosphokinase [Rhodoferax sp.]|nr:2-amino-4-hydroxy-6-hydroxymethyldihydropteridine diphosphokinase [Rhodoferax sp.]
MRRRLATRRFDPLTDQVNLHPRDPVRAYIGLGANLGDARRTVLAAIDSLAGLPGSRLVARSGLYWSAPLEATGPDFVNAVIALQTSLEAHEMLLQLQQIETAAGRLRPYRNAPRTLDLDLLLYGTACINSPHLQVPHPRMFERAFVLLPLAEIAPELVSSGQLAALEGQRIKPMVRS